MTAAEMTGPVFLADKLPRLDLLLHELLASLSPREWEARTIASPWRVKDVAAHLLDGNLRVLSMLRDGYAGDPPTGVNNYEELVGYLNRLNADWVQAMKRVSPAMLRLLLEITGPMYCSYYASLDPYGPAAWPVAWAGEEQSSNWMHIAREYTEKWLHQQQIRDAVGKPGLMTRELFHPLMDVFLRALPFAYRDVEAPVGTVVQVHISSEVGGDWWIRYEQGRWKLMEAAADQPDAVLRISPDLAWKLFSKSVRAADVRDKIMLEGNTDLLRPALELVSVMA